MKIKVANKASRKKQVCDVDRSEAAERIRKIIPILKRLYPNAGTALRFSKPLELLVATILSAQCTDKQVNVVTKEMFNKYRSAEDFANADTGQVEKAIKSTGFFRNKAKNIKSACKQIVFEYGGKVPGTLEELTSLAGVGRKTANVVLGNAFGVPAIVCDTHVIRLSRRLGLSGRTDDAVKLEFDLMKVVPKKEWTGFSHLLIYHGRNVCKARKPACEECSISRYCPSANKVEMR